MPIAKNRREVWEEVARRTGRNPKLVNFVLKQLEYQLRDVITKPEVYGCTKIVFQFGGICIGTFNMSIGVLEYKTELALLDTSEEPNRKTLEAQSIVNQFKKEQNEQ